MTFFFNFTPVRALKSSCALCHRIGSYGAVMETPASVKARGGDCVIMRCVIVFFKRYVFYMCVTHLYYNVRVAEESSTGLVGVQVKGGRCVGLTTVCRLSWYLGTSTSWIPQGLSRPVMGLLYLFLVWDS